MNKETLEIIRYWLQDTLYDWSDESFWCAFEDYFGKEINDQIADDYSPDWQEKVSILILETKRKLLLQKIKITNCDLQQPIDKLARCKDCDLKKKKICKEYWEQFNFLNKLSFLSLLTHYGNVSDGANNFVDDVIMPILKKHQN